MQAAPLRFGRVSTFDIQLPPRKERPWGWKSFLVPDSFLKQQVVDQIVTDLRSSNGRRYSDVARLTTPNGDYPLGQRDAVRPEDILVVSNDQPSTLSFDKRAFGKDPIPEGQHADQHDRDHMQVYSKWARGPYSGGTPYSKSTPLRDRMGFYRDLQPIYNKLRQQADRIKVVVDRVALDPKTGDLKLHFSVPGMGIQSPTDDKAAES